jgi:hypothetical protein
MERCSPRSPALMLEQVLPARVMAQRDPPLRHTKVDIVAVIRSSGLSPAEEGDCLIMVILSL